MKLSAGTIKRVHVNQHNIKANATGGKEPVLTVKTSGGNHKGNRVVIGGPSELVYSPDKPLDCGAKVWIETRSSVEVVE